MFKGKSALRATRFAQTIPARRLTTSLRPQDFQRIPPKSHLPAVPFPRKFTQTVRSASCAFPDGSVTALNRLKRTTGAACRLSITKVFRPRLLLVAAIYSLTPGLKSPENSPISRKILRGWRMATGAFGRGLGKLEIAAADVRAGGEIV